MPEVPDGHELVVLPSTTIDFIMDQWCGSTEPSSKWHALELAIRAAVARRPPGMKRVPWWDLPGCILAGQTEPVDTVRWEVAHGRVVTRHGGSRITVLVAGRTIRIWPAVDGTVEVRVGNQ